jgi:hypothetical protein
VVGALPVLVTVRKPGRRSQMGGGFQRRLLLWLGRAAAVLRSGSAFFAAGGSALRRHTVVFSGRQCSRAVQHCQLKWSSHSRVYRSASPFFHLRPERMSSGESFASTWSRPATMALIRPKCIYFPKHFCYCFSSNLCVLNTTNMNSRCFQQNCSGVLFLCRHPTFRKNPGKYCKNSILPEDPRSQKERRRGAVAWAHHQGARPSPGCAHLW